MPYDRVVLSGVSVEATDYPADDTYIPEGKTAAEREVRTWLDDARKKLEIAIRSSEEAAQLARKTALEMNHARIRLEALETALERMGGDAKPAAAYPNSIPGYS